MAALQLIVGLGNPGPQYEATRHNAGVWFIQRLADYEGAIFSADKKFFGKIAKVNLGGHSLWLLEPTTYMNDSGKAVAAIANFYKIPVQSILVAHDELDIPCGDVRLKETGGHGGHNGLRSIIAHLGSKDFLRLRIGIDHPGHKDRVTSYVLNKPSAGDHQKILNSIEEAVRVIPDLIAGDTQKAFRYLHSE